MRARKPWISLEQIYLISGDIAQINPTEPPCSTCLCTLAHCARKEIPLLFRTALLLFTSANSIRPLPDGCVSTGALSQAFVSLPWQTDGVNQ